MATFSVPVTIGVDEDKIAREIESEVKDRVIRNINDKVEGIIYKEETLYSRYSKETVKNDQPLRNIVERTIKDVLAEKEDLIVEMAAKELADKLSRQKKVKEIAASVAEDVYGE